MILISDDETMRSIRAEYLFQASERASGNCEITATAIMNGGAEADKCLTTLDHAPFVCQSQSSSAGNIPTSSIGTAGDRGVLR